jgi:aminoglycoside phosphotransferase (APT) family kinase protein
VRPRPPAPDPVATGVCVGQLEGLIDPDAAVGLLAGAGLGVGSVTPSYLRIKPGRSALVGLVLRGDGPTGEVAVEAYARTFEGDEAAAIAAKWPAERAIATPFGPGVTLLPGGRTVLFQFPNDGALRNLPTVATADRLRRLVSDVPGLAGLRVQARRSVVRAVRWKPERRFVGAAELRVADDETGDRQRRSLHLRWFPDARAHGLATTARHLGRHGLPVAAQVGVADEGRLQLEATLPGRDGAGALLDGELEPAAVLDVLARLRSCPPLPGREARPQDPVRSARAALRLLASAAPELEPLAAEVAGALCAPGPERSVVHGDLHLHQLLVGASGVGLVDLERSGTGHPLLDTAGLLAHVVDLAVRHPARRAQLDRFLAEVVAGTLEDGAGAAGTLTHLLRAALVERALLALRQLEPGWRERARAVLRRAIGEDDDAVWEVLHPRPAGAWTGWRPSVGGVPQPGTYEPVTGAFVDCTPLDDPALPGLAAWAGAGAVITHRPGRRAVVRTEGVDGVRFVKLVRPRRAEALVARHDLVRSLRCRQPGSVPLVPPVLDAHPEAGTVVLGRVPGRPLHDHLVSGDAQERQLALDAVAWTLSRMRDIDLSGVELGPAADGGDPGTWLEVISVQRPALLTAYAEVHSALPPPPDPPSRPALVHGDLHDRNALLVAGEVGLIDLDGLGMGDPALDAGNLAAHVVLRALQRGDAPEVAQVEAQALLVTADAGWRGRAWTARTLFRLSCLYRFRRRWAHLGDPLLAQAKAWSGPSITGW